jgi:3D (Asp-Asp-Asp) domain-containing protein
MTVWQKINLTAWFVVGMIIIVLIFTGLGEKLACRASADSTASVTLTFYGYPDNDPPYSARIRYPGPAPRHSEAGGVGTYDNPTTVAGGRWPPGTRLYLPYLAKYLIVEDSCAACGGNHIDVWAGGMGRPRSAVLACQIALTPSSGTVPVEVNPPPGHPASAGTLC